MQLPVAERDIFAEGFASQVRTELVIRPSLAYRYAFDFCAVEAYRQHGPVAILASNDFLAYELLKRLSQDQVALVLTSGEGAVFDGQASRVRQEAFAASIPACDSSFPTVIWAEPESTHLDRVNRLTAPGGKLLIVSPGWSARFLPEAAYVDRAAFPLREQPVWRLLRRNGFVIDAVYGFHGLTTIFWGYMFRLADGVGRSDLADRCRIKMRSTVVEQGWATRFAAVKLVIGRRQ
jgi:hypothetical protein